MQHGNNNNAFLSKYKKLSVQTFIQNLQLLFFFLSRLKDRVVIEDRGVNAQKLRFELWEIFKFKAPVLDLLFQQLIE